MIYSKCKWIHESKEDPILIYSEIGSDRYETRKVEVFRNGFLGYADSNRKSPNTGLGTMPFPGFKEINNDPEFEITEITKEEFEDTWQKALSWQNTILNLLPVFRR